MEGDKVLGLIDELLQPREWTDANWRSQSLEATAVMYRAATQLRALLCSVQTLEGMYAVQPEKRDGVIRQRESN